MPGTEDLPPRAARFELEARELERAEAEGFDRPPVEPRPAAGVVLARDAPRGPEVLLVRRRSDLGFGAGAYVFPGGTLDPEDSSPRWRMHAAGWEAHGPEVAPFAVTACRELFEETGVLLAVGPGGSAALHPGAVRQMRAARAGGRGFLELVAGAGLRLDLGRLALCARWITPVPLSRRYDARFFLAEAPPGVDVVTQAGELIEHVWVRPTDALARYGAGGLPMLFPTATTLRWLEGGSSAAEWAARFRPGAVRPILPRLRRLGGEVRPLIPGTREYVEGALRVVRAPNAGPLTLDGTCAYLVGAREVAVIDPGPADRAHLDAIVRALPAGARVTAVALTHAHPDHSEGAAPLAERVGAPVCASAPTLEKLGLSGARAVAPGDTIEFEGDSLVVLPAPGHSADHVAYLWPEAGALFCGDVILGEGSALVAPPDGDLTHYLATLRRFRELDLLWIYPGHGPAVADPRSKIDEYVDHRMERERQILAALNAGAATLAEIRARVYGELEPDLARAAEWNVEAHLRKLEREDRVVRSADGRLRIR